MAKFEPKLLDKPLTPIEALEWRSEFVRYIRAHIVELVTLYAQYVKQQTGELPGADEQRRQAEAYQQVAWQLTQAELLLWDKAMVDFAIAGQNLFYGVPVPENIALRQPEIWFYNYDVYAHHSKPGENRGIPQCELVWPYHEESVLEVAAFTFRPDRRSSPPLIFNMCTLEPGDLQPDPFDSAKIESGETISHNASQSVLVSARIEFLKSTIVASEKEFLPRKIRRQVEREIKHEPIVRVIRLRRKDRGQGSNGTSGGAIDYSCQWLVRPHWRNQYHPSTGERKPVFIDAYVKGPEDKPFKPPKDYVFKVDR